MSYRIYNATLERLKRRRETELRRRIKKEMDNEPAIFARLTGAEYDRLVKAQVPYSAWTGLDVRNELTPYMDSFFLQIPKALRELGWKRPRITRRGITWIVRKGQ